VVVVYVRVRYLYPTCRVHGPGASQNRTGVGAGMAAAARDEMSLERFGLAKLYQEIVTPVSG
jgi:hypothetical protein